MAADIQSRIEASGGYVFVLSCPESPGSIKIGSATREPGPYRYENFGTNEPIPCKVEFCVHVPDRQEIEKNLLLKLGPKRLAQEKNRFAAQPDEAITAVIQLIGYDYTNAQITGVLFRKHVDMLKKMEADFRSRHKSFTILNGELGEMQQKIRAAQRELGDKNAAIERQEALIAELRDESAAYAGKYRTARLAALAAGAIAILAAAYATVTIAGLL